MKNKQLLILIDSGSSHSFMDFTLAKQLKILVITAPSVKVADGRRIWSTGTTPRFLLKVQSFTFSFNFRLLPLGGFDVILRVYWMKVHNPILFDFQQYTITLQRQGKPIVLQGLGDSNSQVQLLNCSNVMK